MIIANIFYGEHRITCVYRNGKIIWQGLEKLNAIGLAETVFYNQSIASILERFSSLGTLKSVTNFYGHSNNLSVFTLGGKNYIKSLLRSSASLFGLNSSDGVLEVSSTFDGNAVIYNIMLSSIGEKIDSNSELFGRLYKMININAKNKANSETEALGSLLTLLLTSTDIVLKSFDASATKLFSLLNASLAEELNSHTDVSNKLFALLDSNGASLFTSLSTADGKNCNLLETSIDCNSSIDLLSYPLAVAFLVAEGSKESTSYTNLLGLVFKIMHAISSTKNYFNISANGLLYVLQTEDGEAFSALMGNGSPNLHSVLLADSNALSNLRAMGNPTNAQVVAPNAINKAMLNLHAPLMIMPLNSSDAFLCIDNFTSATTAFRNLCVCLGYLCSKGISVAPCDSRDLLTISGSSNVKTTAQAMCSLWTRPIQDGDTLIVRSVYHSELIDDGLKII